MDPDKYVAEEQLWWDPQWTTQLTYKAVPLLRFVQFEFVRITSQEVVCLLPLRVESTNHNGSHFGMAIAMAADAAGTAVIAAAAGCVRVTGIHPQHDNRGAIVVLLHSEMDYLCPSVHDLTITASITAEARDRIAKRYALEKRIIEEVTLTCTSRDRNIARGVYTYMIQQAHTLKPRTPTASTSVLYQHRITASARLVAGVRAMETHHQFPLFVDPWADVVADAHGQYLAERMARILPALPSMIAARTRYFDDVVMKALADGTTQILILGVGFDTRMARLPIDRTTFTVYEVDLPDMIAARETLIEGLPDFPLLHREATGVNLEIEDLTDRIVASTSFSPDYPSLVIMEGISFYLDEAANRRVLTSLHRLMQHPKSRLVLDVVTEEVVTGSTAFGDVQDFVEGMRELGEPFLFGISDAMEYFQRHGYRIESKIPSNYYRRESPDELYAMYNFVVVSPLAQAGEV